MAVPATHWRATDRCQLDPGAELHRREKIMTIAGLNLDVPDVKTMILAGPATAGTTSLP
jgi:hypothetical protein